MELKNVDLYQYCGMDKPAQADGVLTCYMQKSDVVHTLRKRPGMLLLPGGGYEHVSGREGEPVALQLLAAGYQVFILQYSVTDTRFPVALREAAMAMRYIREKADLLGVNAGQVAAMGFSAGGHLCGTLGMLYDSPEVADIGPARLLRPDGLALCYPVVVSWGNTHGGSFRNLCGENEALRQYLSLEKLVRPDMPPVFLWHTRNDDCVPCRNSLMLAVALEEAGVDFVLHIYRNGQHGVSTADHQVYPVGKVPVVSWDVPGWSEAMCRFFAELGFAVQDEGENA